MRIVKTIGSRIDYPGYNARVLFTPSCNFRCPTCFAKGLVEYKENGDDIGKIFEKIKDAGGWIDAIVICGGEPTLQKDLLKFLKFVRKIDLNFRRQKLKIKIDTNGSRPEVLEEILSENLADYIALDIKGPPYLYSQLTGNENLCLDRIEESMLIAQNFPDYEFRTTMVPVYSKSGLRWFYSEEIKDMSEWARMYATKGKWYVQPFIANRKEEMLDERFAGENLPKEFHETPKEKLEEAGEIISRYGFSVKVR